MLYKKNVFFCLFFISYYLFSTEINLNVVKLTLDEALKLAEKNSNEAIINKIDKEELDLSLIQNWFVYLPNVSYNVAGYVDTFQSGEETDYQFPVGVEEDTYSRNMTHIHNIEFRQRLFDSSTITAIVDSSTHKIKKDKLVQVFLHKIRYLVRQNYYQILLNEKQINFYKELMSNFVIDENSANKFSRVYQTLNRIFVSNIEQRVISLEEENLNHKMTLLSTVKKPVSKELILTTDIEDFGRDMTDDLKKAFENNIDIKNADITLAGDQKSLSMAFMDFLPEFNFDLSYSAGENITLGVDVNVKGKDIQADFFGNYMFYEYNDFMYINKVQEISYSAGFDKYKTLDFSNVDMKLVGKIDLDKIAKNGINVAKMKNQIVKSVLEKSSLKDQITVYLKTKDYKIRISENKLKILKEKIDYVKEIKKIIETIDLDNNIDKIEYYSKQNSDLLNYCSEYYVEKKSYYQNLADYFQKVDGK